MTTASAFATRTAKRGDGIIPVTLLCLLAAAAAVCVVVLTDVFVGSRDTLAGYVPIDAAVYYHAERGAAGEPAASPAVLPAGFDADEIGVFAVAAADGKSLDHGALVAWRWPRRPTADEAARLAGPGAVRLDSRTYLLADDAAVGNVTRSFGSADSLAADPAAAKILAAARGLSRTQFYFNPVALPSAALDKSDRWLKNGESFAASLHLADGRLLSAAVPRALADRLPRLGLALAAGSSPALRPRPAAAAVFAGDRPGFAAGAVLLGRVQQAAVSLGLKPDSRLASAEQALDPLLRSTLTMTLWSGQAGTVEFLAEYPKVSPRIIELALASYFSASLPDRQRVSMPDGDSYDEFRFNPDKFSFVPQGSGDGATISDKETGVGLTVKGDGRGGSLVASSPAAMTRRISDAPAVQSNFCLKTPGQKLIIGRELISKWLKLIPELQIIGLDKLETLYFTQKTDGILITCG